MDNPHIALPLRAPWKISAPGGNIFKRSKIHETYEKRNCRSHSPSHGAAWTGPGLTLHPNLTRQEGSALEGLLGGTENEKGNPDRQ
jgi:hypothetical protein